jgi:hypothetical protein
MKVHNTTEWPTEVLIPILEAAATIAGCDLDKIWFVCKRGRKRYQNENISGYVQSNIIDCHRQINFTAHLILPSLKGLYYNYCHTDKDRVSYIGARFAINVFRAATHEAKHVSDNQKISLGEKIEFAEKMEYRRTSWKLRPEEQRAIAVETEAMEVHYPIHKDKIKALATICATNLWKVIQRLKG